MLLLIAPMFFLRGLQTRGVMINRARNDLKIILNVDAYNNPLCPALLAADSILMVPVVRINICS